MKEKNKVTKPLKKEEMMIIRGGNIDTPKRPKSPDEIIILV